MNDDPNQLPFKDYFPNMANSTYFWLFVIVMFILGGVGGYAYGTKLNPSSNYPTQPAVTSSQMQSGISPTLVPGDDGDIDYATIYGTFTTDTSYYDQFYIYIDQWKNGIKTGQHFDYRLITKPQTGVVYPFNFMLLDPTMAYILTASACHTNSQGQPLSCTQKIRLKKCPGALQFQGTACIITENATAAQSGVEVDYSLNKADNPLPKSATSE